MTTIDQQLFNSDMKVDPLRAKCLVSALNNICSRITAKASGRRVCLVAVSKLKPPSDIMALYQEGHRHFGENYYQELEEKAALLPKDIKWHFIGGLQSNKCKPLASKISNLYSVSSVDSTKKATQLNLGRAMASTNIPLYIHIQINTSSEESKSGTTLGKETTELALHILNNCPNLHLRGLMTIGAATRSTAIACGDERENQDYKVLSDERNRLEEILQNLNNLDDVQSRWGVESDSSTVEGTPSQRRCKKLELSMGMSKDFEVAIEMGSSEVRIGSTIFGERSQRGQP